MSKIQTLTAEQEARIPEFVERWTKIGLCTDPADRPRAEAAIREMYRLGGLEPPRTIVWCGSPLSLGLTRAVILDKTSIQEIAASVGDNVADSVRASVQASLRAGVAAGVEDSVGASVEEIVGSGVTTSVEDSTLASVWSKEVWIRVEDSIVTSVLASVYHSVCESVEVSIYDSVGDSMGCSIMQDSVYGSHEWFAFYRYFYEVIGLVDQTSKLSGLWELAQSAGWVLPHRNICWVSERHHLLNRDDRGRLHSLAGPACAYPDGWAIYAVHGFCVPAYIVERPPEISVDRIDAEPNAEIRRVMIERYRHGEQIAGAAAFLRDAGAERLDHDECYGTLWRRNIPEDEPIVMVEVVNSTQELDGSRKRYWLRVPPQVQTAREAVAWTFDVPIKDYAPAVET